MAWNPVWDARREVSKPLNGHHAGQGVRTKRSKPTVGRTQAKRRWANGERIDSVDDVGNNSGGRIVVIGHWRHECFDLAGKAASTRQSRRNVHISMVEQELLRVHQRPQNVFIRGPVVFGSCI